MQNAQLLVVLSLKVAKKIYEHKISWKKKEVKLWLNHVDANLHQAVILDGDTMYLQSF